MTKQSGQITVEFLFAIVLILGMTALMFVISISLSVASVTQYVTFAAARNYDAAHLTKDEQQKMAQAKYHELIANPIFKPLYKNGWFNVDADAAIGDHTKIIPEYQAAGRITNGFWGVGTQFIARILDFHIPFFGSTAPDGDGTGSGFRTYIGSYIGREPTAEECIQFTAARWSQIRRLGGSGGADYSTGTSENGYYAMTDDGC